MALPPKWYQFLVCLFASLGSSLFGYDLGVIAGVVDSPNYQLQFEPTKAETGAVVAVFTGGAFVGAGLAGPIGDWLGRKKTVLMGAIIFIVGGVLQTAAQTLGYLYAGRLLAGVGVGFLVMIIPPYQAELCHPDIRGRVTALQQFMLGVGALIATWVTWACYNQIPEDNSGQWRIPLGIQNLPAVVLAACILFFPESPRWLIDHGYTEKGLMTLANLHANGNTEDIWVRAEYDQIRDALAFEHEHEAKSVMEIFRNKSSFRRLFLACTIQASVQMTGVSAIQYYSPDIFREIGIPGGLTLQYQGISSCLALLAQFCCMLFIDYTGRRWTLIFGNLANMVCFIIATILLAMFPPGAANNSSASWGFIVMTWLYNISFSYACGPLSWIIPAEIFDTRTRAIGVSIATMTSFAFNTMIGQVTPIAMENIGWRFYILFCVCNATNALVFWCILPETKKRPLEEMNYLFTNAPLFVPSMNLKDFETHDLENRAQEVERKTSVGSLEQSGHVTKM